MRWVPHHLDSLYLTMHDGTYVSLSSDTCRVTIRGGGGPWLAPRRLTQFSPACDRDLMIYLRSTLFDHDHEHLCNGGPLCVQPSTHTLGKSSGLHAEKIHQLPPNFLTRPPRIEAQIRNFKLSTQALLAHNGISESR